MHSRCLQTVSFALAGLVACALSACSGGGGGTESVAAPSLPPISGDNVLPMKVDAGPPGANVVNVPYVDVTICVPGTSTCQTIDYVLVDTGSTGLRIMASVLNSGVNLPAQTADNGDSLAECAVFADGYSWGSVRIADVKLANRVALSIPIEIIADPSVPSVAPASCSSVVPSAKNSVSTFGAKGVLGVGNFVEDCGTACAGSALSRWYYTCPGGTCSPVAVGTPKQVQNPVARLGVDDNGVVVRLPSVPSSGASQVSGVLILGIGTQSNNALGSAAVFDLDGSGNFATVFGGTGYAAFLDTGSNGLFFDAAIPVCPAGTLAPGFYCPSLTQNLSAVMIAATNGRASVINFSVANAHGLASGAPSAMAFGNLAGPFGQFGVFDWGLPFFYGRTVFTAIEQRATPAGPGPYVAF